MADEMSDCQPGQYGHPQSEAPCGSDALRPMDGLPTLQRNALCKVFDRREFTPEGVALLGYHRLHQADGIGRKGLAEIAAWLKSYGFALAPPETVAVSGQPRRVRKNIELAVRLLRTHGYIVQHSADATVPLSPAESGGKAYLGLDL